MSERWWRAYGRARHDPKLLKLSDKHFRWWFNLVCVASDNDGILPPHADLAVEFRVSGKTMTAVLDALIAAGLFDHDETGIRPHNWNGLQYKSDVSSDRVKRFRERTRNGQCNVSETPSENRVQRTDNSEAKASGAPAPLDTASIVFGHGREWLQRSTGKSEQHCRQLLGKWRKSAGDEALIAVLGRAEGERPIDAVAWIERALQQRAPSQRREPMQI